MNGNQQHTVTSQTKNLKPTITQQKKNEPVTQSDLDALTKKVKTNFILVLLNFGVSFSMLVAVILTFTQVFQSLENLKRDMLEIQSKGKALQKALKPLEAAMQSLGIGGTTSSPTSLPNPNSANTNPITG